MERRIEKNENKQILPAANRVSSTDELRSTDTPRFRKRVEDILAIAGRSLKVPEGFSAIERSVTAQHEQRVELLKRGKLDEGVVIPGVQESIDILGDNLSDHQVAEILKLQRDFFVIEPGKPFGQYVDGINRNKRPRQIDTYYSPYLQNRFAGMPVGGLRIGFAEGKAELEGDPNLVGKKLRDQEKLFKAGLSAGVEQIHPRTDALLQLDGMQTGQLVDVNIWSPLEDNSADRNYLPVGNWYNYQVVFDENFPEIEIHFARWRSAVMVSAN